MSVHVKVCGVTDDEGVDACLAAGVSAIGLNFVPASPRFVTPARAKGLVRRVADRALVVGVIADLTAEAARSLAHEVGLGCLQLHGDEAPEVLAELLPHAYKAIRVASAADVARADDYAGDHLLVDAKVEGALGGTGVRVPPSLVQGLALRRKLTLAGGLAPDNVADVVRRVRPYCVDVASGVEHAPGRKSAEAIAAFVRNARGALAG